MNNDNGKNPKGVGDDFEDIFSSSKPDTYEDIFSDSKPARKDDEKDEYQDIFSGRDDEETPSDDDPFHLDFFTDTPERGERQEPTYRAPVNTAPEKKPYSYHYDRSGTPRRARNGDEIFSGKEISDKPRKKHKHVVLKVIACLLVLVLLVTGGGLWYFYSKVTGILDTVDYRPLSPNSYISSSELLHSDDVRNILFIGVDAREGENPEKTRSDTMMLVSIDTKNKQIKLTSFLRDLYVEIPDYRTDKLNAAQSHGGTQLLVDTIEYDFHVDIDNYMLVSFDMFTTIIDRLGGVDVAVTEKEADYINSQKKMTDAEKAAFPTEITAGDSVHLSGMQALWYSRIRYLDSDFQRTGRQRKVITALIKKAAGQSPTELLALMEEVVPMVITDLTTDEMTEIGMSALDYLKYDIVQQQIPAEDAYKSARRRGMSVLIPDMDENLDILHKFIYEKVAVEEESTEKAS